MRIRSVKPEFFTDRVTGRWPFELAYFYEGLWCLADDEGRFEWEPEAIRCQVFPYRSGMDTGALLEALRKTGHVVKYAVNGQSHGWLPKFGKHQHPNKPQRSKLPAPPESDTWPLPDDSGSTPVALPEAERIDTVALPPGEEGRGEERKEERAAQREPPTPPLRLAPLAAPEKQAEKKLTDPLRRPLSDALMAVYREERRADYGFDGVKDAQGIKRLLSWSRDAEEHARRFREALRSPAVEYGFRVDTIAAFASGRIWNHFSKLQAGPAKLRPLAAPGEAP